MATEICYDSSSAAYVAALVEGGAVKIAPDENHLFELRNGTHSWIYVDHGEMLCQPETFRLFMAAVEVCMEQVIGDKPAVLVNVDSKSSPQLVGALASKCGLRQIAVSPVMTQQAEKGPNLAVRLPKHLTREDTLVVLDDVYTEDDQTAIHTLSLVREAIASRFALDGLKVELLVGLLRGDPGKSVAQLGKLGVGLGWFTTLDRVLSDIWEGLNPDQKQGLSQGGFNVPSSS